MRKYPKFPIPAVSGLIINEFDQILLVKRINPPAQGKWSLPGGCIKLGEKPKDALLREMWEECSVKIEVGSLLTVLSRIVKDDREEIVYHYILTVYICHFIEGLLKAGSDVSEVMWINIDEIKELDISEGLPEVIQKGVRIIKGNIPIR
jgi:mutator protein MutT